MRLFFSASSSSVIGEHAPFPSLFHFALHNLNLTQPARDHNTVYSRSQPLALDILTPVPGHVGASASNFNAMCRDNIGQTRAVTKMCVCVCSHARKFVCLQSSAPSVYAWKCVPRLVHVCKQMDERLRLSLHVRLFVSSSMNCVPSFAPQSETFFGAVTHTLKKQLCSPLLFERFSVAQPPPHFEFINLASINYHWFR